MLHGHESRPHCDDMVLLYRSVTSVYKALCWQQLERVELRTLANTQFTHLHTIKQRTYRDPKWQRSRYSALVTSGQDAGGRRWQGRQKPIMWCLEGTDHLVVHKLTLKLHIIFEEQVAGALHEVWRIIHCHNILILKHEEQYWVRIVRCI